MLLYNKYRATTFADLIGQEHATEALKGMLDNKSYKSLSSIIFACVAPGAGKTTASRIFAKAANCLDRQNGEPCGQCNHCKQFENNVYPDFIEVDGASFNKVEDVKKLVEVANMYPQVNGGTRFIIVDECHRLSNAAWDVMLKLLEEGNNHTTFLFCTTEPDNVRPAIVSRSFVFNLVPLKYNHIYKLLKKIAKAEGVEYDEEVLRHIAIDNEGKTRDAIKELDLCIKSYGGATKYVGKKVGDIVADCIYLAFNGHVEKSRNEADKLIRNLNNISDTISKTLYALVMSKEQSSYVTQEKADKIVDELGNVLSDIVQEYLTYKPDTLEQFKLFLTIIAGKGVKLSNNKEHENKQKRVRRYVEKKESNVTVVTNKVIKQEEKPEVKSEGRDKIRALAKRLGFEET